MLACGRARLQRLQFALLAFDPNHTALFRLSTSTALEAFLAFDIPASQTAVHLKQIERDPFLLLKEVHCFRENTLSACRRARLELTVIFESGPFATILAIVAAGAGLSVGRGCRFIPIADEGAYRRIGIVQLKQHFCSRAHRAFLEHLQQRAA